MIRWDWTAEYEREARARGDRDRVRLATLHGDAYNFRESNPDRALALYDEGRRLAQMLDEPVWVLYYQRWEVHALMHFKRDYRNVIELAVRNTLEARKPLYDTLPHRLSAHEDLVSAYMGVDPVGYEELIAESLRYLEETSPDKLGRKMYVQAMQRDFGVQRGKLDEAFEAARRSLSLLNAHTNNSTAQHYGVFVYCGLCAIEHAVGNWPELGEVSKAGAELARDVGHKLELAECLMWQAVVSRHNGREEQARRFFTQSTGQIGRLKMPATDLYFDALCAYHELAGDLHLATESRRHEMKTISGWGRLAYECRTWIRLCRLLARQGLPSDEERAAAEEALTKLKKPEAYRAALDRVVAGDVSADPSASHI